MILETASPDETRALGRKLSACLRSGDVLCLTGDLGAGKTLLSQGIAAGLEVDDPVTSPTFTVMNVYEGRETVYHFDLYRLEEAEQLADIGFEEYAGGDGVTIIEWPDKFSDFLPPDYIRIAIEHAGAERRRLSISPHGRRAESVIEELKGLVDFSD